ncbi:MAG: cysteine-rich small domain-containing protein [Lachnospiraceae bacterium]|nr:cysteine-rich small domain-containing protein [Lachnospiraceae bacterium]
MEFSSRYFCNTDCEYFPCHTGATEQKFNCLFCYCPMHPYEHCLGAPSYLTLADGTQIKDCSHCLFPHQPEHYDAIMEFLKNPL